MWSSSRLSSGAEVCQGSYSEASCRGWVLPGVGRCDGGGSSLSQLSPNLHYQLSPFSTLSQLLQLNYWRRSPTWSLKSYSQVRSKQQQLEDKLDSVMRSLESVVAKLTWITSMWKTQCICCKIWPNNIHTNIYVTKLTWIKLQKSEKYSTNSIFGPSFSRSYKKQ